LYDGTIWKNAASADVIETAPAFADNGTLWFKPSTKQLFVYQDSAWRLVGPEAVAGFGDTKTQSISILDTSNIAHAVTLIKTEGAVQVIISKNYFTINASNAILGFDTIVPGINLVSTGFLKGNVIGNADTATILSSSKTINGVAFNGSQNITITSGTAQPLISGSYISV
jgi:hypothetical protein